MSLEKEWASLGRERMSLGRERMEDVPVEEMEGRRWGNAIVRFGGWDES